MRASGGFAVRLLSSMYDAQRVLLGNVVLPAKTDLFKFFGLVRYVKSFGCIYNVLADSIGDARCSDLERVRCRHSKLS